VRLGSLADFASESAKKFYSVDTRGADVDDPPVDGAPPGLHQGLPGRVCPVVVVA